jgi:hypothetical protein
MGNPFYIHVSSGQIVFRFEDMSMKTRRSKAITPIQVKLAAPKPIPDKPVSGVDIYSSPCCFKDGSLSKPIQFEGNELSQALSNLTKTQIPQ